MSQADIWGRAVQVERLANAKALWWDCVWGAQGTARRLEQSRWEGVVGKEIRKIIGGKRN